MDLSHVQRLALTQIHEIETANGQADHHSLARTALPHWVFPEEWEAAFPALTAMNLIENNAGAYHVTHKGLPVAQVWREPLRDTDAYLYDQFYSAAQASPTHAKFCERLYGRNILQEDLVDTAAIDDLIELLELKPSEHLLDLGCGSGGIASVISNTTGVAVTGVDYSSSAIEVARARATSKLKFLHADMNDLTLPANSFDAVISVDTLYWVDDVKTTLATVLDSLRPGARMGIFWMQSIWDDDDTDEVLLADNTKVGLALRELDVDFEVRDYSHHKDLWIRAREIAADLRPAYEREGNSFICAFWMQEADQLIPLIEAGKFARYLYYARL